MSNLKALKLRINSVKSTQKMTKAMKMVAASRLKKAKQAVEASRPYADKIQEMIVGLSSNVSVKGNLNEEYPLLTGKGNDKTHLIVVFSSDRGLCGGLNSSTVKFTKNRIAKLEKDGFEVKLFCVGRKAYEQLRSEHGNKVIEQSFGLFKGIVDYKMAQELAGKLIHLFDENKFDVCEVIYSKFKSAIAQEQINKQVIPAPIDFEDAPKEQKEEAEFNSPMKYEPSQEEVLSELLPKNLTMQLYNELLENSASEQGARMAAMEAASNNAGKMIKSLTLVYNRTRQANITRELIDIVSGANAV